MKGYVPILVTLPPDLLTQLDQASDAFGWTRMALIRRCIIRDMQYVLQQELPRIKRAIQSDEHAAWLSTTMNPGLFLKRP